MFAGSQRQGYNVTGESISKGSVKDTLTTSTRAIIGDTIRVLFYKGVQVYRLWCLHKVWLKLWGGVAVLIQFRPLKMP